MFAIITPALITGAFADRVKFKSYLVVPGALEHPRVHPVRALDLGRRLARAAGRARLRRRPRGPRERRLRRARVGVRRRPAPLRPGERSLPHNIAFVALGTGLLWFGWFGFNAGSALAANGIAAQAFVNTDIAGLDRHVHVAGDHLGAQRQAEPRRRAHRRRGRPRVHHAGRRATSRRGRRSSSASGRTRSATSPSSSQDGMKWDDALDVWAVHGVGGVLGTILLGVFASLVGESGRRRRPHRRQLPASSAGRCWRRWSSPPTRSAATFLILKLINAVRLHPRAGHRGRARA